MTAIKRVSLAVVCLFLASYSSLICASNLHRIFTGGSITDSIVLSPFKAFAIAIDSDTATQLWILIFITLVLILGVFVYGVGVNSFSNSTRKIIPGIRIPKASGRGEYGTAEFSTPKEINKNFGKCHIKKNSPIIQKLINYGQTDIKNGELCADFVHDAPIIPSCGILINKSRFSNTYNFVNTDTHALVIGATRCGKTRTISLQTLCIQAMAGESMITVDPKGEMYLYTCAFLKRLGYEVVAIDFDNPNKSTRYNPLQEVIDSINNDDVSRAIEISRDIVATLVESRSHGEPIWTNGERSVLTCAIMSVVWDNKHRPDYQNMANVYYFIAKMCRPNKNNIIPLSAYLRTIQGTFHPAQLTIDIVEISPSKMRGSFYGSALTTLSLYVDPNIYGLTSATEFDVYSTGKKKRAIFIILPDEKETYYGQATLFISQEYQRLKAAAKRNGNRLERRVHFNLEEMGNFTKINNIKSMLTVGGGAGIIFNLYLQSFAQLNDVYEREIAQILRDNCETLIYLQTTNGDTLKELESALGSYTIKSPSVSSSEQGNSSSFSYTGRNLLNDSEIKQIVRPWLLVISREIKAICYLPDISKTIFNKMLGLGSKEHNKKLIIARQALRKTRNISIDDMKILSLEDYFPDGLPKEDAEQPTNETSGLRPSEMRKPVPFKEIF